MTEVREIEISKIEEPKEALRSYFTKEALEELKESIAREGLLQPIIVRPYNDKYEIVAGHRRFIACKELGWEKIPCIVKELSDEETLITRIHENLKREELNIVDQIELIHTLREREGYTYKRIGEIFGKGETWAREMHRLHWADQFIKDALAAGHIKKSHAYVLMKHPDPERRYYFLKLCIENGASPTTLDIWIRDDLGVLESLKLAKSVQTLADLKKGTETIMFTCALCSGKAPGDSMYVVHLCPECYKALTEAKRWQQSTVTESEEGSSGE